MTRRQKLELTWVGKDERPRLEPRILIEDPTLSHHAAHRVGEGDLFENLLIQGDNLLALKALEQEFAGKVKCVFIDPPYNTGSAFDHYEDGIEHSLWLSMMRDRLEHLRGLLAVDGSLWITIDDNEAHYLKILCDEIFGRANFIAASVWQHSVQGKNDAKLFSLHHNYVLAYRKSEAFVLRRLPRREEHNVAYSNPDGDVRGPWRSGDVRSPNFRANLRYEVRTPSGNVLPPPPNGWRWKEATFWEKVRTGEITFVANESRVLRKIYLEDQRARVPETIWFGDDVGTSREASNEVEALLPDAPKFDTPKPERLLERVLRLATDPGDLVLDSFLGSGTTAAVAHKMGRRWIGIELGDQAVSHCRPRLRKIIDGEDLGGITEAMDWRGGGGFRFFRLASSLLVKDNWGNWVISGKYNAAMLAEALCKLEGFHYAPAAEVFWQHGHSTERDFVYITTQTLSAGQLEWLSEQVGEERSLLVLCQAWLGNATTWPNLTLKKIPNAVLDRCEFGRDDYSLQVAGLAPAPVPPGGTDMGSPVDAVVVPPRRRGRRRPDDPTQETLLDDEVTP